MKSNGVRAQLVSTSDAAGHVTVVAMTTLLVDSCCGSCRRGGDNDDTSKDGLENGLNGGISFLPTEESVLRIVR